MLQKVKREIFNRVIGDAELRKALAFTIFIKDHKPASVLKGWSYSMLAQISGCSRPTCKKRLIALRKLGLVSERVHNGVRYLYFHTLRAGKIQSKLGPWFSPQRMDVHIGKIDRSSVKTIEYGLCSLLVVEIQLRKNYAQQVISRKENSKKVREIKRAKRICRDRGWAEYNEEGLSYNGLAGKLGCSRSKAIKIVKAGENQKMFSKQKAQRIMLFIGQRKAEKALPYFNGYHYAMKNHLYYQPANQYILTQ